MSRFDECFERMIHDEGGYQLTNHKTDRGGMTYAGISRVMNPQWAGWAFFDRGETPPSQLVRDFYYEGWWKPIRGDEIVDAGMAETIFNFAVNTSAYGRPSVAVKLAQLVVGATPDGDFGPKTLEKINAYSPALFEAQYALAKIARYLEIWRKDRSQIANLPGWVARALEQAK